MAEFARSKHLRILSLDPIKGKPYRCVKASIMVGLHICTKTLSGWMLYDRQWRITFCQAQTWTLGTVPSSFKDIFCHVTHATHLRCRK